jgi:hypothetical protein
MGKKKMMQTIPVTWMQMVITLLVMFLVAIKMPEVVHARDSVDIINQLDSTFTLHCQSRDNDLMQHDITAGEDFAFSFNENIWGTTEFWCNFWWGNKSQEFTVWKGSDIRGTHKQICAQCMYYVRPDGFYVGQRNGPPPTFMDPWLT